MCADLREGFTTGSAATGAALAAAQLLYLGSSPASVRVPLPPLCQMPPASPISGLLEIGWNCPYSDACPELPRNWPRHGHGRTERRIRPRHQ
ncbi:MAG: cobalt-precorrin-5B (C(1))-methyltransferase [Desulfovibrio sp.]|nr:cobalt-precorrin-5B (C(1))-methyltransferase [Desulfovibrio sp.]